MARLVLTLTLPAGALIVGGLRRRLDRAQKLQADEELRGSEERFLTVAWAINASTGMPARLDDGAGQV